MSDVETASALFSEGCACSQAVAAAFAPRFGLSESEALRVAAGFSAGMRRAQTCGAVTGAIMVLGLAHSGGGCRTAEGRADAFAAVEAFTARFAERHGSLTCRELLGHDISTPGGNSAARDAGLFETTCPALVRSAAELLESLLPEEGRAS